MNCPNCGAENDADARFCAECGTPLDQQDADETIAGRNVDLADNDMTMISTRPDLGAQEKTMRVDQEQLAAAAEAGPAVPPSEPEIPPPPAGDVMSDVPRESGSSQPGNLGGIRSNRNLFIALGVVLILMLCCCCASIFIGITFAEDIERLMGQLASLNSYV